MKKKSLLITLVALTLLSSMLLSSILGVTKAEYFKTLSKKLDFEVMPDMAFQYLVYDSNGATSSYSNDLKSVDYSPKTGIYQNAKSFVQELVIGGQTTTTDTTNVWINGNRVSYGGKAAYKIKIPVDEVGYYTLNFNTHTLAALSGQEDTEFYTVNIIYAFGCQVINAASAKGKGTKFDEESFEVGYRQFQTNQNRTGRSNQTTEPIHYADTAVKGEDTAESTYLWKTTCPYRDERVKLTFKVEEADVEAGYVLWAWDVRGLQGQHGYRIFVDNLSIEKTMELDGTTKYRTNQDPYFMFPQTAYLNNNKVISGDGVVTGKQRVSGGRGTYVTEATANSLGMRAEMLYGSTATSAVDYTDNPLALYIPLKNIEYDTTYKVTFDFSVARQGIKGPNVDKLNGYDNRGSADDWHNYGGFDTIFNVNPSDNPYMFQSYLHSGLDPILSTNGHSNNQDEIKYADKSYHNYDAESAGTTYQYGYPLVKYDEVTSLSTINHTTTNSVNNTYCNAYSQNGSNDLQKSQSRNWFNAVQHTEYNGQNKINWITFYNTTFSFNIPEAENNTVNLDELYWVWAINALKYTVFYNIRIDNVRIEKVVKYTSSLYANGVKIGGTRISPSTHAVKYNDTNLGYDESDDRDDTDKNDVQIDVFRSFRGVNGTGQNWQAKGFVLDEGKKISDTTYKDQTFTADGNIYAPIIDATAFKVKGTSNPYKIELSGFAVCEGGVDRYVFSVDGGLTWHDMTFTGNAAGENQLEEASRGVNQWTSGQTRYDKADFATYGNHDASKYTHLDGDGEFTTADGANSSFSNFRLSADLKDYATQANLDIIIAAVPAEDISLRCEILRIINFNQVRNYVTFPYEFVSDITVNYGGTRKTSVKTAGVTTSRLNVFRYLDTSPHYNYLQSSAEKVGFNMARTWRLDEDKPTSTTSYSRIQMQSYAYEDIRTAFSDFPVKTTLSITGWALVEGGVDAYYWSADYGKTWNPCSGTPKDLPTTAADDEWVKYKQYYYDNSASVSTELKRKGVFIDSKNGNYTGGGNNGSKLDANLKDYEGQVVDVIFAAKPVDSDVYVPVGRIDNVGVYGTNGVFYTRLHNVYLDRKLIATENKVITHAGKGSVDYLSRKNVWSFLYISDGEDIFNANGLGYSENAYTIFEPQNVNPINARSINTPDFTNSSCQNFIESGGKVTVDGYVFCVGGVERYKYSLDGGITWTVINDAGTDVTSTSGGSTTMINYAKRSDNSFTVDDGAKGDFCCTSPPETATVKDYTGTDLYNHALEFNIPALPEGAIRDLLVVAESTKDKLIPVLNIKIKIKNTNNLTHYGYQRTYGKTSDISDTKWNIDYANSINQNWVFTPNKNDPVNKIMNRVTIPVTEAGDYILNLNHRIQNPPQFSSYTNKPLYGDYDSANTKPTVFSGKANTTFALEKTHYMFGEPINVDFSVKYASGSTGLDNMSILIVNQGWKNGNGNRHAIYVLNPLEDLYSIDGTVHTIDLMDIINNPECAAQPDFPPEISSQQSLPAGKYNVYFTNQGLGVQYLENTHIINATDSKGNSLNLTGENWILGKATIYIHDPNETVGLSVIHDGDEYTYYADREKQYSYSDYTTNSNIEPIYNFTNPFDNADLRSISAKVTVTEEDVKRGYIVLDMDYSKLWVASDDPQKVYKTNVSSSTTDKSAYFDNQYPEITYKIDFQLDADALVKIDQFNYYDVPFATSGAGHGTVSIMNNVLINTKATNSYELSVNPILNPPIYKGPLNNLSTFSGAYLSVPKTYFTVGEPITVDYYSKGLTSKGYIYITSDQICNPGQYGDLYIKRAQVSVNTKGRVEFTGTEYNLSNDTYTNTANTNVTSWRNNFTELDRLRSLPAGEYKIYFINNSTSFDPYNIQRFDSNLVTEPITIKVIDPENPDFSIALSSNIPHGSNAAHTLPENESVPTEIILDRVVYEKGENVYFKINGSWVRNWVALLKHDVFASGTTEEMGTSAKYAQHGTYDSIVTNKGTNNYIQTDTLEPGQYKIVYLFGLGVDNAWNYEVFTARNNSLSKIMAIIDITILPEGTLQQHTVTYTKANGQQGKIDLGTNTLAQSIQTPTYTKVTVSDSEISTIMTNAGYSTSSSDSANYGTAASLKYRFGSYQVKPAERNYTVNIPSDMIAGSNNLAYNFSLTTTDVTVYSPQSFNLLCPTYIFRKKSS